jgi:hypothetical protein
VSGKYATSKVFMFEIVIFLFLNFADDFSIETFISLQKDAVSTCNKPVRLTRATVRVARPWKKATVIVRGCGSNN